MAKCSRLVSGRLPVACKRPEATTAGTCVLNRRWSAARAAGEKMKIRTAPTGGRHRRTQPVNRLFHVLLLLLQGTWVLKRKNREPLVTGTV